MSILLTITAVVALLIFVNALYVGAEFATVGARRTRIRQLAAGGDSMARRLLPILEDSHLLDDYVAACQLGITISSLALGAYGERIIAPLIDAQGWVSAAIASTIVLTVLTLTQVVLGELFPKSIAVQYPEKLALLVIIPVRWSQFLFRPLIWLFNGSGQLLLRLLGYSGVRGHAAIHSAEEIEILVTESHEGGLLEDSQRQMLRNAFRLTELTARQVMVHRTRLLTAPIDCGAAQLLDTALESGFTRIPVYRDSVDEIIGFVHVKDAFRLHVNGEEDLAPIVREVVYVPEAVSAVDVWEKLNAAGQYMAIVFDEYGGTAGMITQEDLIEEVVGELQDEFDNEAALVKIDQQERVHLRADILTSDINEYLDLDLPTEGADTIGGLVFSELGRRPEVGDEVTVNGTIIRVEAMDDVRVAEVSLSGSFGALLPQITEWGVAEQGDDGEAASG